MQFARIVCGVALATSWASFLLALPANAAEEPAAPAVAEELGNRTKTNGESAATSGGLSDSAVRVMSTFALSILPDEVQDKTGKKYKLDKSDPNVYLIPLDEARRIIRIATRSAYAEACELSELGLANYEAMYRSEAARKTWSNEQMLFIKALHTFATSYFAGNAKITAEPGDGADGKTAEGQATTFEPAKLKCPPGQKERVTKSIVNFVQSTGVDVGKKLQAAPSVEPQMASPPQDSGTRALQQMMTPAPVASPN